MHDHTFQITRTDVARMSHEELVAQGYALLTHRHHYGGASKSAKPLVQRRLRAMGVRWYVTYQGETDDGRSLWRLECSLSRPDNWETVGVTAEQAVLRFGNGDASFGWKMLNG